MGLHFDVLTAFALWGILGLSSSGKVADCKWDGASGQIFNQGASRNRCWWGHRLTQSSLGWILGWKFFSKWSFGLRLFMKDCF